MVTYIQNFTKKKASVFLKWECTVRWGSSWSTLIRTSNKLKMKSLESSIHPHPPAELGRLLVLQALMFCCCSAHSPFPSTPKSVQSSMQMESLQLEFMLSCPFFSTKKLYFFIVELFKRLHSLLVLTKKGYKGEECRNCCPCIIIPVSQNSQPAFFLLRFLQKAARPEPQLSGAFLWKYTPSLP